MQGRKRLAHEVFNADLKKLEELASRSDNFYVFHTCTGGKTRKIECPKRSIEHAHRQLFLLLASITKPDYLHSGVQGRSYITNAKAHALNQPTVTLDLRKFYPSVGGIRVFTFFTKVMRCSEDVAGLLTRLTTFEGHVPMGGCVSQSLAFFAVKPMLDELEDIANSCGLLMTCYVDDLSFTGEMATPQFLWRVKKVVHKHGFGYHRGLCYSAEQNKLLSGVVVHKDRILVSPDKASMCWRGLNDLGGMDLDDRICAITYLVGLAGAFSPIERRFARRIRPLLKQRGELEARVRATLNL